MTVSYTHLVLIFNSRNLIYCAEIYQSLSTVIKNMLLNLALTPVVNGIALLSNVYQANKKLSYIQQGTHILFTLGFMNNQLFYFVFFRFAASILNRKKYIYISACRETGTCIKREPVFSHILARSRGRQRKKQCPSTAIWPAFSDSWQQI